MEQKSLPIHKTIFNKSFELQAEDENFDYQENLTKRLDSNSSDFNQDILNEVILWKVNRYAEFTDKTINLINSINRKELEIDVDKTKRVLTSLLKTKGVQLAMASTILRFRNPNIYQIIDQRVYRILYKSKTLNLNSYLTDERIIEQTNLYLTYLTDLRKACERLNIEFTKADRILFMADRRINKNIKLNNY